MLTPNDIKILQDALDLYQAMLSIDDETLARINNFLSGMLNVRGKRKMFRMKKLPDGTQKLTELSLKQRDMLMAYNYDKSWGLAARLANRFTSVFTGEREGIDSVPSTPRNSPARG